MRLFKKLLFTISILFISCSVLASVCKSSYLNLPFKQVTIRQTNGVSCEYGKGHDSYFIPGDFKPASGPWIKITHPFKETRFECEASDRSLCEFVRN